MSSWMTKTQEAIGLDMFGTKKPKQKPISGGTGLSFGADALNIQKGNAEMNAGVFGVKETDIFGRPIKK